MSELLPCPFCGGEASREHDPGYKWWTTECLSCNALMTETGVQSSEQADALWNRRTALQATKPDAVAVERADYQQRVDAWMQTCFGPEISGDKQERNWRFGEEALELLQSMGCTKNDAVKLVDYVYDRPQGDINQEVGGVMVTLAALCTAAGFDMTAEGERELSRVWTKVEKIRAKHAAKILRQPLPGPSIPAARSQP